RTVIWDFAGEPVPAPLLDDVRRVAGRLRSGPLRTEMAALLSAPVVDAAAARAERLAGAGSFRQPQGRRPLPWPAVCRRFHDRARRGVLERRWAESPTG